MAPQLLRPDRVARIVNRATRVLNARETYTVAAGDDPYDPDNWKPMGSSDDDTADTVRTGAKVISIGAIIGIVIGVIIFFIMVVAFCIACRRASNRKPLTAYGGNTAYGNGVTYGPGMKDNRSSVGTDDGPPPSYQQSSDEYDLARPTAAQTAKHHGDTNNHGHSNAHNAAMQSSMAGGISGGTTSGGGGGGGGA